MEEILKCGHSQGSYRELQQSRSFWVWWSNPKLWLLKSISCDTVCYAVQGGSSGSMTNYQSNETSTQVLSLQTLSLLVCSMLHKVVLVF